MTKIARLLCVFGNHRAGRGETWNRGYCFAQCTRCDRAIVRSLLGRWRLPPRGVRIVWRRTRAAPPAAVMAIWDWADDIPEPALRDPDLSNTIAQDPPPVVTSGDDAPIVEERDATPLWSHRPPPVTIPDPDRAAASAARRPSAPDHDRTRGDFMAGAITTFEWSERQPPAPRSAVDFALIMRDDPIEPAPAPDVAPRRRQR